MIDSVLKGTGNSRFLKSAVPAGTSWADALAMLQAGTFPIDFNGINTDGFQQVGTPLNKANLLKDATAAQIGLPPSTTPDGMFQALGNTGELHVWRKTVKNAADVPAGYTLGDVKTKKDISATGSGEGYIGFYMGYSDNLAVDDNGGISLNPDNDYGEVTANSNFTYISSVIAGKFILIRSYQRPDDNSYSSLAGKIFYVPADANISMTREYNYLYIRLSKCQDVTGYPLTPAGTTTTYPVSTNPNAYQEGDDAKAAGYTLGEVVTGQFKMSERYPTDGYYYKYASSISVADNGTISLDNPSQISLDRYNGGQSYANNCLANIAGKFMYLSNRDSGTNAPDSKPPFNSVPSAVVYVPSDATLTWTEGGALDGFILNKYQPVTGYAAIPAGTTIEYLGKLGDKARVQVVSYVGTGTYGENNPNSLTFNFAPKIVKFLFRVEVNIGNHSKTENFQQDGEQYYMVSDRLTTEFTQGEGFGYDSYAVRGKKSADGKTFIWYTGISSQAQGNQQGMKYYFIAFE